MSREAQSLLVTLLGSAVLRLAWTDVYLRYVKAGLRPYLLIAGVLLIVIGVASLWRDVLVRQRPSASAEAQAVVAAEEHAGHDHSHGPAVAWLLVLPILAIFLVAPPALGAYSASRGSAVVGKPTSDFAPLPAGNPVDVPLSDYASRAVWDKGRSMSGRTLRLRGFVTPRDGGGYYLTRILISCCAADSRPIKIAVTGAVGGFPSNTWIEVTGRYTPGTEGGDNELIPRIQVSDVREITPPREPYEQ
ncbi:MAG: TIGR03943 family protein [Actinomycetota bacterium]|nr:TIGR03943 family protein [Actinomycetota bacterium]